MPLAKYLQDVDSQAFLDEGAGLDTSAKRWKSITGAEE